MRDALCYHMCMKVFFTASSSGSQKAHRENYLQILEILQSLSHKITNPYYAATIKEDGHADGDVVQTDDVSDALRKRIAYSDCVIAEITVPSISLGIQIEYALNKKIRVLCLYKKGCNGDLPLMVRDDRNPRLFKEDYTSESVAGLIKKFISQVPGSST